jgi:hypothetical protein
MLTEIASFAYTPISAITCAKEEVREKGQPLCLLRQTNFAHQFGVARLGAQGIHREVDEGHSDSSICSASGGTFARWRCNKRGNKKEKPKRKVTCNWAAEQKGFPQFLGEKEEAHGTVCGCKRSRAVSWNVSPCQVQHVALGDSN